MRPLFSDLVPNSLQVTLQHPNYFHLSQMFRKVLWNNGVETGEDEEVVCSIKKPKGQEDGEVDVSRQRTRLETYIRR